MPGNEGQGRKIQSKELVNTGKPGIRSGSPADTVSELIVRAPEREQHLAVSWSKSVVVEAA